MKKLFNVVLFLGFVTGVLQVSANDNTPTTTSLAALSAECRTQMTSVPKFKAVFDDIEAGLRQGYYTPESAAILERMALRSARMEGLCGGVAAENPPVKKDFCADTAKDLDADLQEIKEGLMKNYYNPEAAEIALRMHIRANQAHSITCGN